MVVAKAATPAPGAPVIMIEKIGLETLLIPIVGTSPLIVNKWSEKAKRAMLDAQQGKKKVKTIRDPESDFHSSYYKIAKEDGSTGYGFPVLGFKAATISAARFYDKSVTMTLLRQCLFFQGVTTPADPQQLVEITGEPTMREDVVRLGLNSTDLRYRAEFGDWSATLQVSYITSQLSMNSVLSLIDAGGMGVGVGEWRPEKSGESGTFMIDPDRDIEVIKGRARR